jgi:hypothetical protein
LFNLNKKVKNKMHIKASICKAFIVKVLLTFISYYFEPYLKIRINCVLGHDDNGEVPSKENLSIFSYPEQPLPKKYN